MKQIEAWGIELAVQLRHQRLVRRELARVDARIDELARLIQDQDQPTGLLYGAIEQQAQMFEAPEVPAATELRRREVSREVAVDDTTQLSPWTQVPCPPGCPELAPHVHTADGFTHPTSLAGL